MIVAFSMDSIQASNLLLVPSNISMDANVACIMVCSIIMDDSKKLGKLYFLHVVVFHVPSSSVEGMKDIIGVLT